MLDTSSTCSLMAMHELLAGIVALTPGKPCQGYLRGDISLLLQRQRDQLDRVAEARARCRHTRDRHFDPGIEQILHHHHGVISLFQGLAMEVADSRGKVSES